MPAFTDDKKKPLPVPPVGQIYDNAVDARSGGGGGGAFDDKPPLPVPPVPGGGAGTTPPDRYARHNVQNLPGGGQHFTVSGDTSPMSMMDLFNQQQSGGGGGGGQLPVPPETGDPLAELRNYLTGVTGGGATRSDTRSALMQLLFQNPDSEQPFNFGLRQQLISPFMADINKNRGDGIGAVRYLLGLLGLNGPQGRNSYR